MTRTTGTIASLLLLATLPVCTEQAPKSSPAPREMATLGCDDLPPECIPEPPECDPPPPDCDECKGGVVELTLRYLGGADAAVVIESGDEVYDLGVLAPNEEFTITGTKNDGKFDKNNLEITIDGVEQPEEIHVSCSQPIGPGAVFGAFEVVAAVSKDNGPVCPPPDCLWCGIEDDEAKGASALTFRYNGAGTTVTIRNGKKDHDDVLFDGPVTDGELLEIHASDVGKDKLKSEITFYDAGGDSLIGIHTSCSQPLVPGTVYSTAVGEFELVAGADKNEIALCPLTPSCDECGFGESAATGVRSVELLYTGPGTFVAITNLDNPVPLFAGDVTDGDIIELDATAAGDDALANLLNVYFTPAWVWVGNFVADCSLPFGPGTALATESGLLTVSEGQTLASTGLCPLADD